MAVQVEAINDVGGTEADRHAVALVHFQPGWRELKLARVDLVGSLRRFRASGQRARPSRLSEEQPGR